MNKKIVCLIILLIILAVIFFVLLTKFFTVKPTSNVINETAENTILPSSLFRMQKVVLFSSADAISNNSSKALWDLNIYQYTNIGLYLEYDVPVKRVYLSNYNSNKLYYKLPDDFGNGKFSEDNALDKIVNLEDNPITLINVNKDLAKNYIITNTSELVFDGILLKRAGIKLEDIDNKISFDINIITEDDKHFVCKFSLDVALEKTQDESIYNGYIVDTIESPDYLFYEVQEK